VGRQRQRATCERRLPSAHLHHAVGIAETVGVGGTQATRTQHLHNQAATGEKVRSGAASDARGPRLAAVQAVAGLLLHAGRHCGRCGGHAMPGWQGLQAAGAVLRQRRQRGQPAVLPGWRACVAEGAVPQARLEQGLQGPPPLLLQAVVPGHDASPAPENPLGGGGLGGQPAGGGGNHKGHHAGTGTMRPADCYRALLQ
jgi:hypothetical protein